MSVYTLQDLLVKQLRRFAVTSGDIMKMVPGVIGSLKANLGGVDPAHILDGLVLDPVDKEPTLQVITPLLQPRSIGR